MTGREERGFALPYAMLLVVVVMLALGATAGRGAHLARGTLQARGRLAAHYAAEAGLAKARHMLGRGGKSAWAEVRVGGCDVTVSLRLIRPRQWEISARATNRPAGVHGQPVVVTLREGYGDVTWFTDGAAR